MTPTPKSNAFNAEKSGVIFATVSSSFKTKINRDPNKLHKFSCLKRLHTLAKLESFPVGYKENLDNSIPLFGHCERSTLTSKMECFFRNGIIVKQHKSRR